MTVIVSACMVWAQLTTIVNTLTRQLNTIYWVIFVGGNFCEKLNKALRVQFRGFKFHGSKFHGTISVISTLTLEHVCNQWRTSASSHAEEVTTVHKGRYSESHLEGHSMQEWKLC